jgi:hypothetical protein
MDFWIAISKENALAMKSCLDDFGFSSFNINATEFEKENLVLQ